MKLVHHRWLTAAVATAGVTALTFGGAVLPAAADEAADQPVVVNLNGDKYEVAAAHLGEPVSEVKSMEAAELISITDQGFVYFIDDAHETHGMELFALPGAEGAPIPSNPAAGSRPGAPVTVYLNFGGETLTNKAWNAQSELTSLAFAAAPGLDEAAIWAAVAEDYAPFDVNVTTTRPSDDALYKTSADDNEYGSHVIITNSYDDVLPEATGSGGIAFLGGAGSEYLSGALVFAGVTGGDIKAIAEIASHESGHNFGLNHDGYTAAEEYYTPQDGVWAPIMGAGYFAPLTQWSAGDYAEATNDQDDLATITDRNAALEFSYLTLPNGDLYPNPNACGFGDGKFYAVGPNGDCDPVGPLLTIQADYTDRANYAADTVGDDASTALALDNADDTFEAASVIETTNDIDVFAVTTIGGELTARVSVADISPNLDAKLTLTDADGVVLAENDPPAARTSITAASGLSASISETGLGAGTYYLWVEGVGFGNPETATSNNANGYVKYGSLGNFTISGTAEAFATDPIVIVTPADGTAVTGGEEIAVTGTATPGAQVTLTIADAAVDTATADSSGDWAGAVTVGQYGDTVITASQTIDGIAIAGTDSVTVTAPPAPVAAPVITAPAEGSTVENATPTISGTGAAGATVTIVVRGEDDSRTFAEAVVASDGTWSVNVPAALANGTYALSAAQSLGGVTSDDSATVTFTVAAPANNGGNGDGGSGNSGDHLATTGSDFNGTPFAAMAGVLLLVGAGLAIYARRKHLSSES